MVDSSGPPMPWSNCSRRTALADGRQAGGERTEHEYWQDVQTSAHRARRRIRMTADMLLSRLEMVRRTGAGRHIARCPAHEDRRASLSIRELDDGRVLIHCFAGCAASDIVAAVGLGLSDLFPRRSDSAAMAPERRPFPAIDILRCVAFEALVVAAAAAAQRGGEPLTSADRERLHLACRRLQAASDIADGR